LYFFCYAFWVTYYIFRHGATFQSKFNVPYGKEIETAEILPEGIPVIEKLADYLKDIPVDANFTSPFKRCLQTVEIVTKISGKKYISDDRLHDWLPEKETIQNVIERIENFFKEINANPYNSVSICTHGYPISGLIQLISHGRIDEMELENFPKPGVLTIASSEEIKSLDFNKT